ncbi:hypothetical protein HUJ05_010090 [Dendroctonus ponderosae]|nr:hypothetical protein HUJ05_010090 [Dendroctonus ponderosae]
MPRKLEQEIDLTNALELQTHRLEQRRKIVNCAWQTKGICLGKNKRQIKGIRAKIPLYTTRDLDVAPKGPLKMSFLAPVSLYYIERKAVKHFHANIIECVQLELVAQNVSKQINILRLTQSLDKSSGFRCYHCHQTSKKCNNGDLDEIHQKNCSQRKCTVMKYETPVPGRKVLATIRDCASSTEHDLLRMVSVELKTPAKTLKYTIAANSELFRINRAIHWNQTISGFGTTLYINIAYGIAEIAKYRILSGLGRT